ncbi:ABC-2 type transport system permease protein [Allocatelliglobosispora scoriae]|uniref:Transport permease protein n=1 Tax=Allocatelliglobosispora scoriae TaxID=643052 RepID=A0A841BMK5_9ACTN|nr:ABC transporter permease [Allocatelliglobosispora scoriae]MBB5867982.1 ABC-2 type transport system permease protein [Allocatelliglobosispora scoriae]
MSTLRWGLADAWTVTRRDLTHWRQQPWAIAIGWFFPIMILLMFAGLFGGAMTVPGGEYLDFLLPGVLALTMLFGLETTVLAVSTDVAKGVTDRFRSLPMSASAVVLGRCLADMLNSVVGLAVMIGAGLALGWRWHHGLAAALGAIGLLILLRFALLWVGVYLGLIVKGPESVAAVQILVWPVGFLSGVFVDPATMPAWLGAIAAWNPLSATAAAARGLFGSPVWGGESFVDQYAVLLAVAWPLVLIAVFAPLSVRTYRRLSK